MAILHGSWLLDTEDKGLFIWGETWRKIEAIDTIESGMNLRLPLAMTEAELKTFLTSLQQSGKLNWLFPETAETPQEQGKKIRRSAKNHKLKPRKFTFIPGKSRVFVSILKQLLFSCKHCLLTAQKLTFLSVLICVFGLTLLGGV